MIGHEFNALRSDSVDPLQTIDIVIEEFQKKEIAWSGICLLQLVY